MEIRAAEVGDLESASAFHDALVPYEVVTPIELRRRLTAPAAAGRLTLAALDDHEVVAWGSCGLTAGSDPLEGGFRILVRPDYRNRGLGTRLLEAIHDELRAAGAATGRAFAEPSAAQWAAKWGYQQTRQVHYVGIDPRKAREVPGQPTGVELVALDQVDPRKLYAANEVAQRTKPGDAKITTQPYEDWVRQVWNAPQFQLDLGVAAMLDGEILAFTLVEGDRKRLWSRMTATMPEYRGRGLAKLIKAAALQRAAAAGVQNCYTANYDGNAPMIAVNEWLGYYRVATHTVLVKQF